MPINYPSPEGWKVQKYGEGSSEFQKWFIIDFNQKVERTSWMIWIIINKNKKNGQQYIQKEELFSTCKKEFINDWKYGTPRPRQNSWEESQIREA